MAMKIARHNTAYGPQATATIERKDHPESHFGPSEIRVEKADDGSFIIHKHKRLKPKFDRSENYPHGYREPERVTAADHAEMLNHVSEHFGGKRKPDDGDGDEE